MQAFLLEVLTAVAAGLVVALVRHLARSVTQPDPG